MEIFIVYRLTHGTLSSNSERLGCGRGTEFKIISLTDSHPYRWGYTIQRLYLAFTLTLDTRDNIPNVELATVCG